MQDDYLRDALKSGHLLLWYKIERVLGEGGFGITYLAHDVNLDKLVAIKEYLPGDMCHRNNDNTISPNINSIQDFNTGLNRFIREARTLAKFEHPNVVKISNVFEENNTAYMAMAYEKGKDLKELLRPRKTINEDYIFSIILPVLEGLEYVHDIGFIHRDIKPGNIMIREDGSPVLIDFGSVHNTKKSQVEVTTIVSPGYTPHEQYLIEAELQGPWTDIYSLGATLYRCISGVNPIDAINRSSAIIKQLSDPLPSAMSVGKDRYNEYLLKAIDHALAFNEKDRPQSIGDWRDELVVGRLLEKGDTLNAGNFISGATRGHKTKLDKTIVLTQVPKTSSKKRYPYIIAASLMVTTIAISMTFLNNGQDHKEARKQHSFPPIIVSIETPNETLLVPPKEVITESKNNSIISSTTPIIEKIIEGEITDTLSDGSAAPTLIIIPKGSNIIGSSDNEEGRRNDEGPQILITIKDVIAIGKTEITIAEFTKFVNATNYKTEAELDSTKGCRTYQSNGWDWTSGKSWKVPGYEQQNAHPVVCVSWKDAMTYVKWLSTETGHTYQLPSEAIWEYASRADTTTSRFWGDEIACEYSNVSDFSRAAIHGLNISSNNIFLCEDGNSYSAKVASFKPNQYGLYDMIGNVWEWTIDCWNEDYTNLNNDGSARLEGNCNNRIYRGGSWGNLPTLVRAAKRLTDPSHYRYYNLGFRVSRIIDN